MSNTDSISGCLACRVAHGRVIPPGGFVYEDALWTVNHLMAPASWRGWLVLQPRRHVEMFHELNPEELSRFTVVLSWIDEVLRVVLRPEKVYVCLFAEAADCQHLHFHIIPRYTETPARGPAIFQLESGAMPLASKMEVMEIVGKLREQLDIRAG